MTYFMTIFSIGFLAVLLTDILNLLTKKSGRFADTKNHWEKMLLDYKWMALVAIGCAGIILYNNFLFLNVFGVYRVEAMPCGTLYCHVEVKTNNGTTIYPCKISKENDIDGVYYNLETIYMNGKSVDISEDDIQVFTDHFVKHSTAEYKIVNIKYTKKQDVSDSTYSFYWELADLILGISCIYTAIKTVMLMCNSKKESDSILHSKHDTYLRNVSTHAPTSRRVSKEAAKMDYYNNEFKKHFGDCCHPYTGKPIETAQDYIDAVRSKQQNECIVTDTQLSIDALDAEIKKLFGTVSEYSIENMDDYLRVIDKLKKITSK